ncbi:MAG: orotidine-5'-phosphate decarboxylase [Planctomycetota bacterium]|nr:MAG: orotidine-5'-phosphate decarboxylase [Planctomycetota bacterium]REK45921.1 MAG: orotidine-5'-phosphate decarboxylase [Planctomycetota bacterium]
MSQAPRSPPNFTTTPSVAPLAFAGAVCESGSAAKDIGRSGQARHRTWNAVPLRPVSWISPVEATLQAFSDRLADAIRRCGNPVLVGLDPRFAQLPDPLRADVAAEDLAGQARAYQQFCHGVIDAVAEHVPAVKPQAAFFEELGPAGMEALGQVIKYAAERGLLVILDGKRNDIGSTATAYARGYLGSGGQSPWGADALTVNPYLGDDSLAPFVEVATERGAGLFVLTKTSNPGGGMFQDLEADAKPLYRHVAAQVEALAKETVGHCGYGAVGAVAGATYPEQLAELRAAMPHAWLLVPGFGAQGGAAADVAAAFDEQGYGAIVNNSRGIIFAHSREPYRDRFKADQWREAVAAATREMIAALREATPAGRLA